MNPSPPSSAIWTPGVATIEAANLTWLMRRVGVADYPSLHAWSVRERERFWELAIERLGVRLRRAPQRMLDVSEGVERARWLVGAELNIAESCFGAAPETTAIVHQSDGGPIRRMTVGELDALSNRVARGFLERGLEPGDTVALVLPMTAEAVAAYLGILKAGAAAVGIPESFSPEEIAVRLRIGGVKWVVTQDVIVRAGKRHELHARLRSIDAPPAVVVSSGDEVRADLRATDVAWNAFLPDDSSPVMVVRSPDDLINVLFSSGTTGEPKAIPWTQLCPIKCASDGHFHQDIHPGDVVAWPTSMGWMMGPWLIFASLMNRASLALFGGGGTDPGFGRFVQEAGVTMLGVVPSLVAGWRRSGCLEGRDWSGIRVFSSTGECSNPDDMRWLMQFAGGRPILEYCGGTELSGGYLLSTVLQPSVPSTFTSATLGTDFVILDETGRPADRGEVFLIPPAIGMSTRLSNRDHHEVYYADCPPGPAGEVLRRHGDELERLPEGSYRAHGRVDDTMNLGGIKVSSAEIERVLNGVDGVRETAAVAEPPPGGGPSRLVMYAVLHRPIPNDELLGAMQTVLRRELNPLFKIHRVIEVPSLPRTASNKVMRRLLRGRRGDGS